MNISDDDRDTIAKWAKANPEILRVWLFGSRARGDNDPGSDIDIAVETVGDTPGERLASFMFAEWRDGPKLSRPVHMQIYDEDTIVKSAVDRDGVCLFTRQVRPE